MHFLNYDKYMVHNKWRKEKKNSKMWSHISLCFFQHGTDVQSSRSTATRIPMSKGMKTGKAVLGLSTTSRSESQSMKIELRKSSVCSSAAGGGGKSWDWLMLMWHWKLIQALQNWTKSEQKCCNVKQSNQWHWGLHFWIKKCYCNIVNIQCQISLYVQTSMVGYHTNGKVTDLCTRVVVFLC